MSARVSRRVGRALGQLWAPSPTITFGVRWNGFHGRRLPANRSRGGIRPRSSVFQASSARGAVHDVRRTWHLAPPVIPFQASRISTAHGRMTTSRRTTGTSPARPRPVRRASEEVTTLFHQAPLERSSVRSRTRWEVVPAAQWEAALRSVTLTTVAPWNPSALLPPPNVVVLFGAAGAPNACGVCACAFVCVRWQPFICHRADSCHSRLHLSFRSVQRIDPRGCEVPLPSLNRLSRPPP